MKEGMPQADGGVPEWRLAIYYLGYFVAGVCSKAADVSDKVSKRIAAGGPGGDKFSPASLPVVHPEVPLPQRGSPEYQAELDALDRHFLDDVVHGGEVISLLYASRTEQ